MYLDLLILIKLTLILCVVRDTGWATCHTQMQNDIHEAGPNHPHTHSHTHSLKAHTHSYFHFLYPFSLTFSSLHQHYLLFVYHRLRTHINTQPNMHTRTYIYICVKRIFLWAFYCVNKCRAFSI